MLNLNKKGIELVAGSNKVHINSTDIFSETVCSFLNDLSKNILTDKSISYADVKTLAFWVRKKNLDRYVNTYVDNMKRIGVGLALHIAPSNIPTNFAYSFIFGLISGNSNVIRLSEKKNEQSNIIITKIAQLFKKKKYEKLSHSNAFIRYKQNDFLNQYLCKHSDARVVWGGNDTVEYFKGIKAKPKIRELFFPDRFSISILNANKLKLLSESAFKVIIQKFYNDTYIVDQNACSSPRLIVWLNDKKDIVKQKFWSHLRIKLKNYDLSLGRGYEKILILYELLSSGKYKLSSKLNEESIYVIRTQSLRDMDNLSKLKLGIFFEYDASNLDEVFNIDVPALQTLSYFGLTKEQIFKSFNKKKKRAFDRVVPIGSVLEMDMNWDGHTIPYTLSRIVNFK